MTQRHELDDHRRKLSEIRSIMHSMKTLAVMETHKLDRYIEAQKLIIESIRNMAADFLHFHPQVLPEAEPVANIIILIGSERGFCGDFNEQLVAQLDYSFAKKIQHNTMIVAVGRKLHPLLKENNHNTVYIEGANVAEEIASVVESLAQSLASHEQVASLYVLHHNNQHNDLIKKKLLPPFEETNHENVLLTNPPILNLTYKDFFLELTDHYLFSALNRILYVSLMFENQRRIQHLENATHYLDEKQDELNRKINTLRQEEIIEEIEVILLNTTMS